MLLLFKLIKIRKGQIAGFSDSYRFDCYPDQRGNEEIEIGRVDVADGDNAQVTRGCRIDGEPCTGAWQASGCRAIRSLGQEDGNLVFVNSEEKQGCGFAVEVGKVCASMRGPSPASWLIERNIIEARKKMNLSHWEQMPVEEQEVLKVKIIQEAKSGDMPPMQYLALHWNAKLSMDDLQALLLLGKSSGASETTSAGADDAVRGKTVFEKRCTGCHAIEADREGPRLAGVFGRKAGSVAGYAYSAGLKKSGLTWTDATLEKWLSDPDMDGAG